MAWSMMQVAPEVRLAWSFGPVKPFVGLGVGITEGTVQGGAKVTTKVTVDPTTLGGLTIDEGDEYASTNTELFSTIPARFTVRPHAGFDLDLGALVFAAQLDFALLNSEQVSTEVDTSALNDFDPAQEGGMFGDASQDSQNSAAVVLSLAMRVVF
jgi:acyl CoA:acetate/3-ketoacid CoA transferase